VKNKSAVFKTLFLLTLVLAGCSKNNPVAPAGVPERGQAAVTQAATGLILWNKLGSEMEVYNSVVGVSASYAMEPVFDPGLYGGCVRGLNSGTGWQSYIQFNPLATVPTQGTVQFWVKGLYSYYASDVINAFGCSLNLFRYGNTWQNIAIPVSTDKTTWKHVALVWNAAGIDGNPAHTNAVYLDGVLLGYSNSAVPSSTGNKIIRLDLGSYYPGYFFSGWVDDLKMFNYSKTDFSDRFQE